MDERAEETRELEQIRREDQDDEREDENAQAYWRTYWKWTEPDDR